MHILISILLALAGALALIPMIISWAKNNQIIDPNDERKCHKEQVCSLGGMAIWPTVLLVSLLMGYIGLYLFGGMLLLWLVSLIDDLSDNVTPYLRLLVQIVAAMLAFMEGVQLNASWAIWINMPLTVLFIVWVVNAFNFIDGINGLAGSLGVVASIAIGGALFLEGSVNAAIFSFMMAGSLLAFLRFNFGHQARIFMGDNGSAVLGMALAVQCLQLTGVADGFDNYLLVVLAVIGIPFFDLLRVVLIRISQYKSPFSPDRNHIHHFLVDYDISAPSSSILIVGWQLTLLLSSLFSAPLFWLLTILLGGFLLITIRVVIKRAQASVISLSFPLA